MLGLTFRILSFGFQCSGSFGFWGSVLSFGTLSAVWFEGPECSAFSGSFVIKSAHRPQNPA